jgi:hypothetical protein
MSATSIIEQLIQRYPISNADTSEAKPEDAGGTVALRDFNPT